MKLLREWVKRINIGFIWPILAVFYFLVIGLSFLLMKLANKDNKKGNKTYWQEMEKKLSLSSFKSPY